MQGGSNDKFEHSLDRNPIAMNLFLIFFVKTQMPKGYLKVVLKETVEKIFLKIEKRIFIFFNIFKKSTDFIFNFPKFFGSRSLQIRGLFFIGSKFDFL